MNNDTIGVDVSKDHLDAHRLADGATRRFPPTNKGGHKALIKWLAETPLYRVVVRTDRASIIAPSNARSAHRWRSVRQGQSASGAPFPLRRPASWRRPIAWMRRSRLAHGLRHCWNWRRAQPEASSCSN